MWNAKIDMRTSGGYCSNRGTLDAKYVEFPNTIRKKGEVRQYKIPYSDLFHDNAVVREYIPQCLYRTRPT